MATSRECLAAELAPLITKSATPPLRALAAGDLEALHLLAAAVRGYYDVALAPYWSRIRAQVAADINIRAEHLLKGGVDRLLHNLHPSVKWRSPMLEIHDTRYREVRDVNLAGRGLRLIPSWFCTGNAVLLQNPRSLQVLVYPASREVSLLEREQGSAPFESLATLLGTTRASVLEAIGRGCTTTELARRVGVSPSAASRHAKALRGAGLVHTDRVGGAVHHTLSPLGADLLRQHCARRP